MNYRYITYSGRVNGGCARQTLEDHGWSMVLGTVVSNAIEVWTGRCPQAHRKRANSQDYPKNRGEEWRSSSTEAKTALYAGLSHKGALFRWNLKRALDTRRHVAVQDFNNQLHAAGKVGSKSFLFRPCSIACQRGKGKMTAGNAHGRRPAQSKPKRQYFQSRDWQG